MGVDVEEPFGAASLFIRQADGARAALGLRVGRGDVVGVAGVAIAAHFRVDVRAARNGVVVVFQHDDGRALAKHEAGAPPVKGQGAALGVRGLGQRLTVGKAADGQRVDGGFAAAGEDGVGIAVADGVEGLADGGWWRWRRP